MGATSTPPAGRMCLRRSGPQRSWRRSRAAITSSGREGASRWPSSPRAAPPSCSTPLPAAASAASRGSAGADLGRGRRRAAAGDVRREQRALAERRLGGEYLRDADPALNEAALAPGQVEVPHAPEAAVVAEVGGPLRVGGEALAPAPDGFGV